MKLKSVVFTVALAAASSAFATGTAYLDASWFSTNSTQTASIMPNGTFDTLLTSPIVITNDTASTAAPVGLTLDSYKITAYMTNLVVHATLPAVPAAMDIGGSDKQAIGAICAATDDGHNKWYGLYYNSTGGKLDWAEITKDGNYADEGAPYVFVTSFKASTKGVTYSVKNAGGTTVAETDETLTVSESVADAPSRFAFAGTGAYTNLVAEFIVSIAGSTAVRVEGGTGMIAVNGDSIYDAIRTNPDTQALNGLKNWVNYVLGIDAVTATTKPYPAPVQNNQASKLTFGLGGVNVRAKDATGADVEYTIEKKNGADWESAVGGEYKSSNSKFDVNADSSKVNYYRIKIRIDPVH